MTPAVRAAEIAQIAFQLHPYDHDLHAENFGTEAATKLGLPAERVFKTLIAKVDARTLVMVLVPVADRLDLKKLAGVMGSKKADMADPAAAERATGYVVGGISPLGGRKRLPAIIDKSVQNFETVFVSAGQRGLQMELAPRDLIQLTGATLAPIASHS